MDILSIIKQNKMENLPREIIYEISNYLYDIQNLLLLNKLLNEYMTYYITTNGYKSHYTKMISKLLKESVLVYDWTNIFKNIVWKNINANIMNDINMFVCYLLYNELDIYSYIKYYKNYMDQTEWDAISRFCHYDEQFIEENIYNLDIRIVLESKYKISYELLIKMLNIFHNNDDIRTLILKKLLLKSCSKRL